MDRDRQPREGEKACFEAGIKLGALYHQFTGTALSDDSIESLKTSIEDSVESQRYVTHADVEIEVEEYNRFGYTELEGEMLDVEVTLEYGDTQVEAVIEEQDGYPMMKIKRIE